MEALRLIVTAVRPITDRIKVFELAAASGELPLFTAGSHLEFHTGIGETRSYSLANDPGERHRYEIAVLREGAASAWLHDHVAVGHVLEAGAPRNAFAIDETGAEHLLLAGGIGITPLRSMAFHLRRAGVPFRLLYCSRSLAEAAYGAELVEEFGEAVIHHHDGGDPARSLDLKTLLADYPPGGHLYVCGPRGLIDAARKAAEHWPAGTVHFELFTSSRGVPPPPVLRGDFAFEVELRRSGKVITVPADQTLLQAMIDAGVKPPSNCREGWCGNCELPLLGGRADHRDEVLTDEQKASNTLIQTCVSRALPGERLVIDR